ncbi:hypothetical protein [Nitratidesulfovibrio sp. 1201_IL3209]|uniref:hypothetical protein n=1 Tax=Nitratidesulfovibrio sp. 1201_IL3209 TaxID=3084053 RepID=UPI002FD9AE77
MTTDSTPTNDASVFPDPSDDDLWTAVRADMERRFPGRYEEAAVRRAFEAVCAGEGDYLPLRVLLKKVRMACMWTRPSLDGRAEGAE